MRRLAALSLLFFSLVVAARELPKAPLAKKLPAAATIHGEERVDEYAWLRDKSSPEVIRYLEAENAYADAMTSSLADFRAKLYEEMLGRIKQTDVNVPYRKGG